MENQSNSTFWNDVQFVKEEEEPSPFFTNVDCFNSFDDISSGFSILENWDLHDLLQQPYPSSPQSNFFPDYSFSSSFELDLQNSLLGFEDCLYPTSLSSNNRGCPDQDGRNQTVSGVSTVSNHISDEYVWNELMKVEDDSKRRMGRAAKRPRLEDYDYGVDSCVGKTMTLSRESISEYFYMPITQAAKEMNIGLTLLKKRCREVGIRRWPHRKLMSLQTLINNVQEMGDVNEEKSKVVIEMLEREMKLMEDVPDRELGTNTKKLRQACFKANYKKRKHIGLSGDSWSSPLTAPDSHGVERNMLI